MFGTFEYKSKNKRLLIQQPLVPNLLNSLPQQEQQPDDACGQNRVAESGDVRQEADVGAVDLQHAANCHGGDGNNKPEVVHDIPGSE